MARVSVHLADLAVFLNALYDVRTTNLQKDCAVRTEALQRAQELKQRLEAKLEHAREELIKEEQRYDSIQQNLTSYSASSADDADSEYRQSLENAMTECQWRIQQLQRRVEMLAASQFELGSAVRSFEKDFDDACAEGKRRLDYAAGQMEGYYNLIAKAIGAPAYADGATRQMVQRRETEQYDELQASLVRKCHIAMRASPLMDEQRWNSMLPRQRKLALDTLACSVGQAMGVGIQGCDVFQWVPGRRGSYDGGQKINLNVDCTTDPARRLKALETIVHECRHAFQKAVITNPQKFAVPLELVKKWKDNYPPWGNYIQPGEDPLSYTQQPIEKDAFVFAAMVLKMLK